MTLTCIFSRLCYTLAPYHQAQQQYFKQHFNVINSKSEDSFRLIACLVCCYLSQIIRLKIELPKPNLDKVNLPRPNWKISVPLEIWISSLVMSSVLISKPHAMGILELWSAVVYIDNGLLWLVYNFIRINKLDKLESPIIDLGGLQRFASCFKIIGFVQCTAFDIKNLHLSSSLQIIALGKHKHWRSNNCPRILWILRSTCHV